MALWHPFELCIFLQKIIEGGVCCANFETKNFKVSTIPFNFGTSLIDVGATIYIIKSHLFEFDFIPLFMK